MKQASHQRGFTLPEVLATLMMTGIILPVALSGITVGLRMHSAARHRLEAGELAQSKINEMLVTRDTALFNTSGDFGNTWPAYRWDTVGQLVAYTTYEVTVSVYWKEQGTERTLRLSTLVYPTGDDSGVISTSTGDT